MNVLDIDLDFFLDRSVHNRADDPSNRPDDEGIVPWQVHKVTNFVETTLNIGTNNAGRIVQNHDEVFYQWKTLIEANELTVPFKIVHVDAHSDLGLGFPSWQYLHAEFLSIPVSERPGAKQGNDGVNFGSFLAFAVGCRWISEIDFIINRNWHDDIHPYLLSGPSYKLVDERSPTNVLPYGDYDLTLELMRIESLDLMSEGNLIQLRKPVGEPRVPLNIITIENVGNRYSSTSWDYVFLSRSPGYVPSYADHLVDPISKYIKSEP